jgi:hypothetical protein
VPPPLLIEIALDVGWCTSSAAGMVGAELARGDRTRPAAALGSGWFLCTQSPP